LPLLDGQVHHDTHAVPRGNYVIGAGNYLIATPSELGNYMIADTDARTDRRLGAAVGLAGRADSGAQIIQV
jgi:hypothetical protein